MWKQVKVGDMLKAGDRIRRSDGRRTPGGIVATDVTVTAGSTHVGYTQDGGFGLILMLCRFRHPTLTTTITTKSTLPPPRKPSTPLAER
jgi:hypothetical protein